MNYLAELQVTNPESLLMIASYKDLENLCRFVGTQSNIQYLYMLMIIINRCSQRNSLA